MKNKNILDMTLWEFIPLWLKITVIAALGLNILNFGFFIASIFIPDLRK